MPGQKSKKSSEVIEISKRYIFNTYSRQPVVLTEGEGCYVWDADGKKYLDFLGGIAVCVLGHSHPAVTQAIRKQAGKLLHVSNLYYIENQAILARLLVDNCFADKVFFCNSGAESIEGAIKLARKFSNDKFGLGRNRIITMKNSFHGRTLGALSATGQEKFHQGFEPLIDGFDYAEFNNINSVIDKIDSRTCAIMLEPIQCEGGVHVASMDFLKAVRDVASERNLLLIFDEVQTGMGRTGKLFAYQHFGIEPDIMTLAKGLANGVPIGAVLAKKEVADVLTPGTHASTFGGNPLSTAAGIATLKTLLEKNILKNCAEMGKYLKEKIEKLKKKFDVIKDVRGMGLMLGIEIEISGKEVVELARESGLLINCTSEKVLRLAPPLIVNKKQIDVAVGILEEIFKKFKRAYTQ
jgi:predicted acetylornithine/succinylornithine family transaminase